MGQKASVSKDPAPSAQGGQSDRLVARPRSNNLGYNLGPDARRVFLGRTSQSHAIAEPASSKWQSFWRKFVVAPEVNSALKKTSRRAALSIKQASTKAFGKLRNGLRQRLGSSRTFSLVDSPTSASGSQRAFRVREDYVLRLGIPHRSKFVRRAFAASRARTVGKVVADKYVSEDTCTGLSLGDLSPRTASTAIPSSAQTEDSESSYNVASFERMQNSCEELGADLKMAFAPKSADQARMSYLQKLSYERVLVPRPQRPPSHQTIIVFDWDDTLICTSFLKGPIDQDLKLTLKEMEKAVIKLLEMAMGYGTTFIITNAVAGWVEASAAHHLPGILPILQRVRVISARSRYEAEFPDKVSEWKKKTFLDVKSEFYAQAITNIVSLGDSSFEMEAAVDMGKEFDKAVVKTVKFRESLNAEDLLKQQDLVSKEFDRIVRSGKDLKVRMKPHSRSRSQSAADCSARCFGPLNCLKPS